MIKTIRARWLPIILIGALTAFCVASVAALYIYSQGQTDHAAPADVIIVLGAGVRPNGSPNAGHMRRAAHAAALYKQGLAPFVLCTGGFDLPGDVRTEADVCADLIRQAGVPATAILTEEISQSTEQNAIEAQKVMQAHGLTTALVVSDNFHLLRSAIVFKTYNIPAVFSPAEVTSGPLDWRSAIPSSYREVAALAWYAIKSALHLPYTESPW